MSPLFCHLTPQIGLQMTETPLKINNEKAGGLLYQYRFFHIKNKEM